MNERSAASILAELHAWACVRRERPTAACFNFTQAGIVIHGGDCRRRRRPPAVLEAASERLLWTLPAHKSPLIALHFEGADIVTRGFGGDVSRWTVPGAHGIVELPRRRRGSRPRRHRAIVLRCGNPSAA